MGANEVTAVPLACVHRDRTPLRVPFGAKNIPCETFRLLRTQPHNPFVLNPVSNSASCYMVKYSDGQQLLLAYCGSQTCMHRAFVTRRHVALTCSLFQMTASCIHTLGRNIVLQYSPYLVLLCLIPKLFFFFEEAYS